MFARTTFTLEPIFQVIFANDGSLYIDFPYFDDLPGIVALVVAPPLREGIPQTVRLDKEGHVTSHMVKYAHHWSGEAHFSKDSKVKTKIRKMAMRLNQSIGHLFTIQVQNLEGFEKVVKLKDRDHYDEKRTVLTYRFTDGVPPSIKFVGDWYSLTDWAKRFVQGKRIPGIIGSSVKTQTPEGDRSTTFLLSSPDEVQSSPYALGIRCVASPEIGQDTTPKLIMMGGFDPRKTAVRKNRALKFLALSYPVTDFDELKHRIGSIDFESNQ